MPSIEIVYVGDKPNNEQQGAKRPAQPREAIWPPRSIPATKDAEQAKAICVGAASDWQYEYLLCTGCGHRFQRLDWGSALHALYHAKEGYNVPSEPECANCGAAVTESGACSIPCGQ